MDPVDYLIEYAEAKVKEDFKDWDKLDPHTQSVYLSGVRVGVIKALEALRKLTDVPSTDA